MMQQTLFDLPPTFSGETFDARLDGDRLTRLQDRVMKALNDGRWYTIQQLQAICGGSEASVSARIRDCRQDRWGGHVIEKRRKGNPKDGIWEYRMSR